MGQVVSFFFGCICGKAEKEESSSNLNLQTCQLIAPPSLVSCIGSTADVVVDQFMVHDSGIQGVEDKRQVYPPTWDSCSDLRTNEVLQQDQLNSPPTVIPSIDSRTIETLQQDQLIAPPTVLPTIDSGTNEPLQQDLIISPPIMFPSINSSTNEALQQDLPISPPAVVPIMDSSNNAALNYDLFIAHSTLVPSIDSSTNDALEHDLFISPSTVAPCIDPNMKYTSEHDLFIAPSTVAPCIDSGTSVALEHDLFIAPSIVVPSIGSSTNDTVQHDLGIAPGSTVVSSIDSRTDDKLQHDLGIAPASTVVSSSNEALLQFDLINSVILFLGDGMKICQRVEDLKRKKPVEEEGRQVKNLCTEAVEKQRKIKHYSSCQKILLVGEGDFSFSACLAMVFGSASNMFATSLDSKEFLSKNYEKAMSNIGELKSRGCKVMHGVDATKMANNCLISGLIYDRIIYNFPLAGFFPGASRKSQLKRNKRLVLMFLDNAKKLISDNGEIHITHKSLGFFLEWNLQQLASQVGLRLIEEVPFNLKDYKGYNTKYGFGGDDNFDCNPSKTYKFGLKLRKHS